jgi:hypothetical protein
MTDLFRTSQLAIYILISCLTAIHSEITLAMRHEILHLIRWPLSVLQWGTKLIYKKQAVTSEIGLSKAGLWYGVQWHFRSFLQIWLWFGPAVAMSKTGVWYGVQWHFMSFLQIWHFYDLDRQSPCQRQGFGMVFNDILGVSCKYDIFMIWTGGRHVKGRGLVWCSMTF